MRATPVVQPMNTQGRKYMSGWLNSIHQNNPLSGPHFFMIMKNNPPGPAPRPSLNLTSPVNIGRTTAVESPVTCAQNAVVTQGTVATFHSEPVP